MGKKVGRFARPKKLVAPGIPYVYYKTDKVERVVNCKRIESNLAVHFSHASTAEAFEKQLYPIKHGIQNVKDALERRSEAAMMFLEDYKEQCSHEE
mmetsp:Transcript_10394/g.15182  ORF Transcript_10394/g.15182 Transcript_10394/m.15182 type:complete len:96 (+) Transcript_10394:44-331(+)